MAIKSVSAWPETRGDIQTMIEWTKTKLEALGASVELRDVGKQTLPDGRVIPLPNVIFGQLGTVSGTSNLCCLVAFSASSYQQPFNIELCPSIAQYSSSTPLLHLSIIFFYSDKRMTDCQYVN